MVDEEHYDKTFFEMTVREEAASSGTIALSILNRFNPRSVIDVGCGCGIHLRALLQCDSSLELQGYDGSAYALTSSLLPEGMIMQVDLTKEDLPERMYDVCLCFEVAEHIAAEYSLRLVQQLCGVSNLVLFTAAPPGQGGANHVNEQPQEYWIERFASCGFEYCELDSHTLRDLWTQHKVIWWLARNIMVFRRTE